MAVENNALSQERYDTISQITNAGFCQKARAFTFVTKNTEKPENYTRAAVLKDTIKAALALGERDPKHIMEYMASRYEECCFPNYQQKRIFLLWDHRRVMRYLNDETRTPQFLKGKAVQLGTRTYMVRPDFCFVNGNSIEVVTLKIGKPDVTKRGKKNAEIRDLRLFAMVLYARELGFQQIKASFYFLKKNSDGSDWMSCEQSFFGGGGNVVSLTDLYTGVPNDTDEQVERAVRMLDMGVPAERMCEKDCEECEKKDLCKFLLPPVRTETENTITQVMGNVNLTPDQMKAVCYHHGIARINAGAGAGKTMSVAFHLKYLIENGVKPEEICCVTFTNAGAKEMRKRAESYTGRDLSGMVISTFNAFQYDIVKDNWEALGFSREPKVIDDVERYGIIAELLRKHPVYEWTGNSFLNFTSTAGWQKGALQMAAEVFTAVKKDGRVPANIPAQDIRRSIDNSDIPDAALGKLIALYEIYEKECREKGLLEFDDQEILAFRVLDQNPGYLTGKYPFRHIVVDEFQDSSEGQIEFIKRLRALPTFESLMVIGDDSQAIFGFRNTSPDYIINFPDYMGEPVDDIYLLENHRSTPEIIDFANKINAMNEHRVVKDLIATRGHGPGIIVNGFYNKKDEYRFIADGIKQHLSCGFAPEQIAVIAYSKSELREIADMLARENIPAMFAAPEKMMENSRIRAILAFARVIQNTEDTKDALVAANAAALGQIMEMEEGAIREWVSWIVSQAEAIRQEGSLKGKKELFLQFIDGISCEDEAVEHFKDSLSNKDFDEILRYCSEFSLYGAGTEFKRLDAYPGVVLVTAHSAKGLEWDVVYNTVSRYHKKSMKHSEVEEIRRLLFVSATRARDELIITGLYDAPGSTEQNKVSNRFLFDALSAAGREVKER